MLKKALVVLSDYLHVVTEENHRKTKRRWSITGRVSKWGPLEYVLVALGVLSRR
jgi:hypothetical protein